MGIRWLLSLTILVTLALITLIPACASNQKTPTQNTPTQDIPTRHHDLSSRLWYLIDAEKLGEAQSHANKHGSELLDGREGVRVRRNAPRVMLRRPQRQLLTSEQ